MSSLFTATERRLRPILWTALTALVLRTLCTPATAQVGLGLSPMRLELGVAPGAAQSGVLTLSNESPAPIRVRAQLLDFYIDQQGTPQFAPVYDSERDDSCRAWLSVNPMETEVAPGKAVPVRYTLRVPRDLVDGSFHCAVGFTTLPTLDRQSGLGLRAAVRMVAALYAVVGDPEKDGEVATMRVEPAGGPGETAWTAVVVLRNRGLMHFRPAGDFTILDEAGSVVESVVFPMLPVLPHREQAFRFRLKSTLTAQRYTLRTRVDIGANEVQETTLHQVPTMPER